MTSIRQLVSAACIAMLLASCSTEGFTGASKSEKTRAKKSLTDGGKLTKQDDGADGADAQGDGAKDGEGKDGEGKDGKGKDGGAKSGEGKDDDADEADESAGKDDDPAVTEDEAGPCRFFDDKNPDYKELVKGGPKLEISPKDFKGRWEGKRYVFEFSAWQGSSGATAQLWEGRGPMVTFADLPVADFPVSTQEFLPKDKDHWQLTPVMMGVAKYGVKHTYNGVVENAKSESCELELTETEIPFLDRTGGGCFALTTKIRMADGSDRFVALLNVGDEVWSPITKKAARITAITSGPEADKPMYEVAFGRRTVTVTGTHPFPTPAGLKAARDLRAGDLVTDESGATAAVTTARALPVDPTRIVRNLVINPDATDESSHLLLADGIVTGDLYLQRRLEARIAAEEGVFSRVLRMLASL